MIMHSLPFEIHWEHAKGHQDVTIPLNQPAISNTRWTLPNLLLFALCAGL
jgi:hypothetical protein